MQEGETRREKATLLTKKDTIAHEMDLTASGFPRQPHFSAQYVQLFPGSILACGLRPSVQREPVLTLHHLPGLYANGTHPFLAPAPGSL